jgi:hypothetical protein
MTITLNHIFISFWTIECKTNEANLEQDMATMQKLVAELENCQSVKELKVRRREQFERHSKAQQESFTALANAMVKLFSKEKSEIDANKDESA